jgi:hypothetical protein
METFEITLPYAFVCKHLLKRPFKAVTEDGKAYEVAAVVNDGKRCTVVFERV